MALERRDRDHQNRLTRSTVDRLATVRRIPAYAACDQALVVAVVSHEHVHQTRSVCDDVLVSVADHQTLRVLEGRYVLERAVSDVEVARDGEVLAVVRGPDGGACMRRQDAADDAWVALWNGDEAHPPDATGM